MVVKDQTALLECENLAGESGPGIRLEGRLHLHAGEIVGLTGPSGSGKSLFLRAIARMDVARSDRLTFAGQPAETWAAPAWRAEVTYLPPTPQLWGPALRDDFERVRALGTHAGKSMELERAAELLEAAGVARRLDADPATLSTGERQRAALVRAVWTGPSVLLLDEPTAALDEAAADRVESLLARWVAGERRAAIWAGHDLARIRRASTRVLEVAGSRVRP